MASLEVPDAALELLLTLIDNERARRRTLIKPEMLEAFRELSLLGLAETTKSADWPEYLGYSEKGVETRVADGITKERLEVETHL